MRSNLSGKCDVVIKWRMEVSSEECAKIVIEMGLLNIHITVIPFPSSDKMWDVEKTFFSRMDTRFHRYVACEIIVTLNALFRRIGLDAPATPSGSDSFTQIEPTNITKRNDWRNSLS